MLIITTGEMSDAYHKYVNHYDREMPAVHHKYNANHYDREMPDAHHK